MQSVETKMLERMQEMMAAMSASVPEIGRNNNTQPSKTEKGESFQDLMNKAQSRKDAPATEKPVDSKERPAKAQAAEKPADGKTQADGAGQPQPRVTVVTDQLSEPMLAALAAGAAQILGVTEDGKFVYQQMEGTQLDPVQIGPQAVGYPVINADGERVMVSMAEIESMLDKITGQKDSGEFPVIPENKLDALIQTIDGMNARDSVTARDMADLTWTAGDSDEESAELSAEASDIPTGQPLFRDLEGTPEKVGDNFQLDTQKSDMDAQLANTIRQAAEAGLRQVQIKLSPENLGSLTIQLTQSANGALHVVLHATSAKAANLLTQHLDSLNLALQGMNQNQVHIEVQRHEDAQQAQQQLNQQADPDGHNRQQHQQQRREDHTRSEDFLQQLRLGLFQLDEVN